MIKHEKLKLIGGVILAVFLLEGGLFFTAGVEIFAQSTSSLRQRLETELERLQQEIEANRQQIQTLQQRERTLRGDIQEIEAEIDQVKLQLEATGLEIQRTNFEIDQLSQKISQLQQDVGEQKHLLAGSLRQVYQLDQRSLLELVIGTDNLTALFTDFQFLKAVQQGLQGNLSVLQTTSQSLKRAKEELLAQQRQNQELYRLQQLQRNSLQNKIAQKESLIARTRSQRSNLRQEVAQAERSIQEIRQRLFILQGLAQPLQLEEAYQKARKVADKTGVRPAFLLAVLKRESDWGSNVGGGSWRTDMHPRDRQAFLEITEKLGLDPDAMPVSSKPPYGWGGAMGPAQFLPTTWLTVEKEVAKITGNNPPSPWNIDDAFAASATLLARAGATDHSYNAEWRAAMRYFAGSNWNHPAYSFYGDGVMSLAKVIQEEIDKL